MVLKMEDQVTVDRQGRLVLPAKIRKSLGLEGGETLLIRLSGNRATIEVRAKSLEERLKEFSALVKTNRAQMMTERTRGSWKWMSEEYARKKLGLR